MNCFWVISDSKKALFWEYPFLFSYFFIKQFLHTFCQKRTFCYPTTFIESLMTHNNGSFFQESNIVTYVFTFQSSSYFYWNWIVVLRKNKAEKKSFDLHTFCQNRVFVASDCFSYSYSSLRLVIERIVFKWSEFFYWLMGFATQLPRTSEREQKTCKSVARLPRGFSVSCC